MQDEKPDETQALTPSLAQEEILRRSVEWAPSAMIMVDQEGRIVLGNAQAERLFGYTSAELAGQPVEVLVPERFRGQHPHDRRSFAAAPQPRPMGVGRDLFARHRDGSEFQVEIGLNPISTDSGPMVLVAVVDITERKRQEERFRRMVEYAPSAMVLVDKDGLIAMVNAQAERLFGYVRDDLVGQPVEMLVPDRFRQHHGAFRHGFHSQPQARPMGMGRDLFARRHDGSEFPVEIGLNPIDTGEGSMVLASIVDLTERQRVQQGLERALQEKTVLLNEVHHRVKNNLQVVSSLLNLQAQSLNDPLVRAALDESQNRVRAMALTHQLLYERKDFSRLDLGEYLERLTSLLRSSYRGGSRVELRLQVSEEKLYLDLERAIPCGLVVNELVSNAFKHAFPGDTGGEIFVALAAEPDGMVLLTVADTGVGMPFGFDMTQVKSLGLQLVPLLVEQILGTLIVPEQSVGTCFSVRFPLRNNKEPRS
ncbi:MAG: PAS domain S-box protein [Rhodocyclaceae bacterium]|nr:MAG: PAS domain S-box protein [Rhodocyclaceae bacterium]